MRAAIFQPGQLTNCWAFPRSSREIEDSPGLAIGLAYCPVAVLMNNPEFLQRRLLE